ncbi:hypothetical protein BSKO_11205 [Bryopsis sp. KO-2023]|nr:hypothetical protein BSKO_11205 [Bryopsis sp. KO-2023]
MSESFLQRLWRFFGGGKNTEFGELDEEIPVARVGIVGAGAGGSCAAFFLKESLGRRVQIDIFEAGEIGGRAESFEYEGKVYELGAAIVYNGNKWFREIADKVGAKRVKLKDNGTRMSVYNGTEIVFQSGYFSLTSLYRIFRQYGWVPMKYGNLAKKQFLSKFKNIYKNQQKGEAYDSPKEMLESVEMYDYTQTSARKLLQEKFGGYRGEAAFEEELAAAVNRVNYNQGMDINAFAGLVSYLPAADSNLFVLKNGIDEVPKKVLEYVNAKVVNSRVTSVKKQEDGSINIETRAKEGDPVLHDSYDAVIVATPLEMFEAAFSGFDMPKIPSRQFQTTVTTYVRGKLKSKYFNADWLPKKSAVFVTEHAKTPFSSVAFKEQFSDGTQLFKIFSSEAPSKSVLSDMFEKPEIVSQREWLAYPVFDPPETFSPFVFTPGIFYNNAIENSASALEMSAIAGKNSANLSVKYLREKFSESW